MLPIVLLDLIRHPDDLLRLENRGLPVCALWTVRPHGLQTTKAPKVAAADKADPKKKRKSHRDCFRFCSNVRFFLFF